MATKLLLADDSVTIHKVVSLTFAAEDVQIEAVTDGSEAIEKARATRPDVVLADVSMPGRNGYEVCAAIKSDPILAGTPVVLLVGTFEPFDELEASRVKCDAYLTKPFDTSELIQIVRHLVEQRAAAKAAVETSVIPQTEIVRAVAGGGRCEAPAMGLVSERARASFLGPNRILDLFDVSALEPAPAAEITDSAGSHAEEEVEEQQAAAPRPVIPFPGTIRSSGSDLSPGALSQDTIDLIVEKVVSVMSQEVIREIAWEVVPEISEIMIRQYLDELRSKKS